MVVVTTPATTHAWATPVRPVCVCVADESRWMSTRTPSGGGVWRACGQSANQCVCVCGWEEPHKARHVCACEVRRGICESVAGVAWRVRGERGHMGRQRGWWVWWPRRSHTHTQQRGWHHSGRVCVVPPLTHTQRTGRGSAHSGGGWWERRTVVVAATPHTQPPPPRAHHPVCVCVNREWTAPAQPVSGPSGHTRHNTHAATTTSTTSSSSSKRRSGVVWGTRSGWTCEWRARRGHSQHRGHTHTRHQSAPATTCVCVSGVVVWLGCVSEWQKEWAHGQEEDRDWDWVVKRGGWVVKD